MTENKFIINTLYPLEFEKGLIGTSVLFLARQDIDETFLFIKMLIPSKTPLARYKSIVCEDNMKPILSQMDEQNKYFCRFDKDGSRDINETYIEFDSFNNFDTDLKLIVNRKTFIIIEACKFFIQVNNNKSITNFLKTSAIFDSSRISIIPIETAKVVDSTLRLDKEIDSNINSDKVYLYDVYCIYDITCGWNSYRIKFFTKMVNSKPVSIENLRQPYDYDKFIDQYKSIDNSLNVVFKDELYLVTFEDKDIRIFLAKDDILSKFSKKYIIKEN